MDSLLEVPGFPDYPHALNGLQVAGPDRVERVVGAVDASLATIEATAERGADLLIVHHGLFWGGVKPLTGAHLRKVRALVEGPVALYSAHLPLDAHPELGNCALLAGQLGLDIRGPFGTFQTREIGCWGAASSDREGLADRLRAVLGGPVRLIPGGPDRLRRVAVVTGGGSSFLTEAAAHGMDALVTGEASHHSFHDAHELGVNLYLGGHYATETWGARALAERVAEEFGVEASFLDLPTGL